MIRVAHVVTRTNIGGVSNYIWNLVETSSGNIEHILIRGVGPLEEGDYFEKHPMRSQVIGVSSLQREASLVCDLRTLVTLTRLLREIKPDIVHTHMAKAGTLGRLAAVFARIPVRVHTFHGHLLYGYFGSIGTRVVVTIERILRRITSFSITNGETVRQDLIRLGVVHPLRSIMIAPAVSTPIPYEKKEVRRLLGIPEDSYVVGFVGRLAQIKRPDRVLSLAHRLPGFHFAIFGDGPLRHDLESQSRNLVNLTLHGWIGDPGQALSAIDLLVLTSDNEAIAIVLIEAALAGIPIVAMDVGAVKEFVRHEQTGLLAHNIDELEQGIHRIRNDHQLRATVVAAARQLALAAHSGSVLGDSHIQLYTTLVRSGER